MPSLANNPFINKYFNLWREDCVIQRIFFILKMLGLFATLAFIVYIWTSPLGNPDDVDPVTKLQTKIIKEFAVRLTIFLLVLWIANFVIQTVILNMFCRSSYNKGKWGMILYFILFMIVFALISTITSYIFSPILFSFWKQYKVKDHSQPDTNISNL